MSLPPRRHLCGRFTQIVCAVAFVLGLTAPLAAESTELTLPEARRIALAASQRGDHASALPMVQALLEQNPRDSTALLALGTAKLSMGEIAAAYRAGRLSFRYADTRTGRYEAARLAAVSSLAGDHNLRTRFWLRRAGDTAPDALSRARVIRNYRALQAQSPWRSRFDFSVSPSDNVNGGSDSAFNIIDGVPVIGILSGSARALPGVIAQAHGALSYRLSESATRRTLLTAALTVKKVHMDDPPVATLPGETPLTDADLGASFLRLGLAQTLVQGRGKRIWDLDLGLAQSWQGGDAHYHAVSVAAGVRQAIGKRASLSASARIEQRGYASGADDTILGFGAGLALKATKNDLLTAALQLRNSDGVTPVLASRAVSGTLGYELGQPLGPVQLSGSLGGSYVDYPDYTLGFLPVPGGRQDSTVFAQIDMTFHKLQYAGFSPSLRVRQSRTKSNVSRFTGSELAISFGLESKF